MENGLSNVLVVVTRYFGGILLGTGGLVRAYSDVTIKALNMTQYVNKTLGCEILLNLEYDQLDNFKYYANKNNIKIIKTEYLDNIQLIIEIDKERTKELTNNTNKKTFKYLKCDILKEKYIEK